MSAAGVLAGLATATPLALMLGAVAALIGLSPVAAILARLTGASSILYGAVMAVCLGAAGLALTQLLSDPAPVSLVLTHLGLPGLGAHFRLDALSLVFLVVINLGGALASLYALGYGRHEPEPGRVLPFYPLFLAGMNLVVMADDAFSFLVAWEFMSLSSWALVMARHRDPGVAEAGYLYLIMASFGALCLLAAFGLMAHGDFGFSAMRAQPLTPMIAGAVLILAILGAGSKAGLVPLHVWLPLAHPAAPSHISALMSGVMTKVAVYAFLRIVFDLLGPAQAWWSVVVLALGAATAVLGVLYALMQTELKRSLAYSTVENIGVIFVGLGLSLAFKAQTLPLPAALALTAALFHLFNHSLFKSLLFFGAGAVQEATGQRDLDQLGGLIRRLPTTAALMLVGCAAISALPPLNGFASEWLTFQAILLSPALSAPALKILAPAVGAALALAAALTAAAFVRLFGVAFLGRPRSLAAAQAGEVDSASRLAMALAASLCVLAGALPGLVIDALAPAARALTGARMPLQVTQPWLTVVPVAESRSTYNGLLVLVFIAVTAMLAAFAIHRLASRAARRAPAWDCGYPDPSPLTQYSASGFAQPIRRVFAGPLFGARDHVDMPAPGDARPARLWVTINDPIWDGIYAPIARLVDFVGARFNRLQFLTIRVYLSLVFFALVALLLALALWT